MKRGITLLAQQVSMPICFPTASLQESMGASSGVVFGITCQSAVHDPSKLSLSKFALQVGTTFLNKQVKKS